MATNSEAATNGRAPLNTAATMDVAVKQEPGLESPPLPDSTVKTEPLPTAQPTRGRRAAGNRIPVEEIVGKLTAEGGQFPRGIYTKDLYAYTHTLPKDLRPNNSKNHLQVLLSRSVEKGKLVRLAPSLYTTSANAHNSPTIKALIRELRAEDNARIAAGEPPKYSRKAEPSNIVVENIDFGAPLQAPSPADSGDSKDPTRPQRKRVKKKLGPEFVEWAKRERGNESRAGSPASSERERRGVICDACFLSASTNLVGKPEPLLRCRDCPTKVHPSCLGYDAMLTARCRREPWQCADCKTCLYCATSTDSEHLLFCDFCDRAAHMACLRPPLSEKPEGKWACNDCLLKDRNNAYNARRRKGRPPQGTRLLRSPEKSDSGDESRLLLTLARLEAMPTCNCGDDAWSLGSEERERVVGGSAEAGAWSVADVTDYITGIGFPVEAMHFKDQMIDGAALLLLSRGDLTGPELGLKLGPALKIHRRVRVLQQAHQDAHAL